MSSATHFHLRAIPRTAPHQAAGLTALVFAIGATLTATYSQFCRSQACPFAGTAPRIGPCANCSPTRTTRASDPTVAHAPAVAPRFDISWRCNRNYQPGRHKRIVRPSVIAVPGPTVHAPAWHNLAVGPVRRLPILSTALQYGMNGVPVKPHNNYRCSALSSSVPLAIVVVHVVRNTTGAWRS